MNSIITTLSILPTILTLLTSLLTLPADVNGNLKWSDLRVKRYEFWHERCSFPTYESFHPLIVPFIEIKRPLACDKAYKRYTFVRSNGLQFDLSALARDKVLDTITCCYRKIHWINDNKTTIDDPCVPLPVIGRRIAMPYDLFFIKVECHNPTYVNYHGFTGHNPRDDALMAKRQPATGLHAETAYSLIMVVPDAVGRGNAIRQLVRTRNVLLSPSVGALELKGFNKVGINTGPNFNAYYYGQRTHPCYGQRLTPNCTWIWNYAQQLGYRTLFSEDFLGYSTFSYYFQGFGSADEVPFSAYMRGLMHYVERVENYEAGSKFAHHRDCFGPYTRATFQLEYLKSFMEYYSEDPLLAVTWINRPQHDDVHGSFTMDDSYAEYFTGLFRVPRVRRRAFVIFMSDHGFRFGGYHNTYQAYTDDRDPMFMFRIPDDFRREFPRATHALEVNTDRLTTPHDVYATLRDILTIVPRSNNATLPGMPSANGTTLLVELPESRDCSDAQIASDGSHEQHWCLCHTLTKPAGRPDSLLRRDLGLGHAAAVRLLNALIMPVFRFCVPFTVDGTVVEDWGYMGSQLWSQYRTAKRNDNKPIQNPPNQLRDMILVVAVRDLPVKFEVGVRVYQNCSETETNPLRCPTEKWGEIVPLYERSPRDPVCVSDELAHFCLCRTI